MLSLERQLELLMIFAARQQAAFRSNQFRFSPPGTGANRVTGTMRFNPQVRLDPSQVIDRRPPPPPPHWPNYNFTLQRRPITWEEINRRAQPGPLPPPIDRRGQPGMREQYEMAVARVRARQAWLLAMARASGPRML